MVSMSFLMLTISLFKFSLRLSIPPLGFLNIHITIVLNSYLVFWLLPFHLILFLEISLVPLFGAYFFASLFCLCVLGRSAMTPKLVVMALWWRYLVGISGTIFQITCALCSRKVSYGLCVPSYRSWVLNAVGLSVGGVNPSGRLTIREISISVWVTVKGLLSQAELFPVGSGACWNYPWVCCLCG